VRGFVYLISSANGLHKIGRAFDPEGRFVELGGKVKPLTLVHTIECAEYEAAEQYLHVVFKPQRVHGEWFRLTDSDVEALRGVATIGTADDWPETIRTRHATVVATPSPPPSVAISMPGEWVDLLRAMASERAMPAHWLLVQLLQREAEAKGRKELPAPPWSPPKPE